MGGPGGTDCGVGIGVGDGTGLGLFQKLRGRQGRRREDEEEDDEEVWTGGNVRVLTTRHVAVNSALVRIK